MNEKIERIKLIYSELGIEERKEIREFIREYEDVFYDDKKKMKEDLRKSLGPLSSAICPYCGR